MAERASGLTGRTMDVQVWLAFALTSFGLVCAPGPVTLLAASYALALGRARAAWLIPGAVLGDFIAMAVSLLSLGAVIALAEAYIITVKLIGGLVLFALGVRLLRRPSRATLEPPKSSRISAGQVFWSGFVLTALHPASFAFFPSFAPQFMDPARDYAVQAVIMVATFVAFSALAVLGWLLGADFVRATIASRPTVFRKINIASAAILVVLGAAVVVSGAMALSDRAAEPPAAPRR